MTSMETNFLSDMTEDSNKLPNNTLYRKGVGSLLYISKVSRPDIAAAVRFLCRCVETPTESSWNALKRVMRYLASTIDMKLRFSTNGTVNLECYADADWAGDKRDRKSTSGYVFFLSGNPISWSSRKQTYVSMSCTEAEICSCFSSQ